MEALIAKYWPLVMGAIAVLGTIFYNNKKVQVDESAMVLATWKELAATHQADMKRLRDDMDKDRTRYEAELEHVRHELKEVRAEFLAFRKSAEAEIKARDIEIAGLKRTISQISQSTAVQLGRVKGKVAKTDEVLTDHLDGLDRAGGNSIPKGEDE